MINNKWSKKDEDPEYIRISKGLFIQGRDERKVCYWIIETLAHSIK